MHASPKLLGGGSVDELAGLWAEPPSLPTAKTMGKSVGCVRALACLDETAFSPADCKLSNFRKAGCMCTKGH